MRVTRRAALAYLPAASLLQAQASTPLAELVNVMEMRDEARRKLTPALFAAIEGSDRRTLERMTFRPRLMVDTTKLDLSMSLFGSTHFAPILAAPLSGLALYHAEAEVGVAKGAAAAKTLSIISRRSGNKLADVVAAASGPWWYQIDSPDDDLGPAAECQAVCLTLGREVNWAKIGRLRKPLVLKGVLNPRQASMAVEHGAAAMVVSNYGAPAGSAEPMEVLAEIVDKVQGRVPVLVDGGFRRGTDILKALALGAKAVLIGRPLAWGLTAYGSAGVQSVLEMLQTELARNMALGGRPNLASIDRTLVRMHSR